MNFPPLKKNLPPPNEFSAAKKFFLRRMNFPPLKNLRPPNEFSAVQKFSALRMDFPPLKKISRTRQEFF